MKRFFEETLFDFFNNLILILIGIVTIYPFIYVLSMSLSDADAVRQGTVWLLPKGFNIESYKLIIKESDIVPAYLNSIIMMIVGTIVSLFVTVCAAYPLSKKRLRGATFFAFFISLTMWIKVPMIPFYLIMHEYRLDNTMTGIIVAFAFSAFYTIMMRTAFQSIPESLEESAKIDGANDLYILWKVYLPLTIPTLATLTLYFAVGRWNGYFWSMLLLRDESLITLQVLLKRLVVEMNLTEVSAIGDAGGVNQQTYVYSTLVLSIIPMLVLYPFVQKYFVKGVMVGAVKG